MYIITLVLVPQEARYTEYRGAAPLNAASWNAERRSHFATPGRRPSRMAWKWCATAKSSAACGRKHVPSQLGDCLLLAPNGEVSLAVKIDVGK